jgi:hypothetical protein
VERAFESMEELAAFFADGYPDHAACSFQGAPFDVYVRERTSFAPLIGFAVAGVLGAAAGSPPQTGLFARIGLPASLGLDLRLRSRADRAPVGSELERFFDVQATSVPLAESRLAGEPLAALIRLREKYSVEMTDEALDLGPLTYPPAETAADVALALAAVASLGQASPGLPEADLGPDAIWCYHCGMTVRAGTTVCPECGAAIDSDSDDEEA